MELIVKESRLSLTKKESSATRKSSQEKIENMG